MEFRNLLMILFIAFLLLTILTLLFVPRADKSEQVVVEAAGGCIASCGNDAVCVERCKTAAVNQAVILGDTSKCDELADETERAGCLGQLQFNQALQAGNPEECDGLSFAESCKNLIYFNKAVSSKNKSYCSQITDGRTREMCNAA